MAQNLSTNWPGYVRITYWPGKNCIIIDAKVGSFLCINECQCKKDHNCTDKWIECHAKEWVKVAEKDNEIEVKL